MLEGDDRIIIVCGMAHSGTTIFAKTLVQCSKITCVKNGSEKWLLENSYLPLKQTEEIQKKLDIYKNYVLFKRPWTEELHDYFKEEMPNAHIYCMLKTYEESMKSWLGPKSMIPRYIREDRKKLDELYEKHYNDAVTFQEKTGCYNFRLVPYAELINSPRELFDEISKELNLNFSFGIKDISPDKNIKQELLKIHQRQKHGN